LWDLLGKSLGTSVATLLGGFRDRLPIIAIAAYYEEGKTLADLGREMGWLKSAGMAGCKVKVGGLSAEADAERVAACRAGGASEAGGITEWRRAAGLCQVHGIELAHHEEPQIAVHMLAAVPNGTYVECFPDPERDPLWAGFITNRAPIRDGIIEVPQGPGFGL